MTGYTVSEVNRFIKQIFLSEEIFYNIAVCGEISNFVHHRSGHMYFTLKDAGACIKCVMFCSDAQKIDFVPKSGLQVVVRGNIGVFERDGVYQIYVVSMRQSGDETRRGKLDELVKRLAARGCFDANCKRCVPGFPSVIGVVTAENSAAFEDVVTVVGRRYPLACIKLFPAQVQGDGAVSSICAALAKAAKHPPDVLIIGRGGGSAEDLAAFDEEAVVLAVCDFPAPVISAVGHETDTCLVDLAADLRASTPSAAAEMAVPSLEELKKGIDNKEKMLYNIIKERINQSKKEFAMMQNRMNVVYPLSQVRSAKKRIIEVERQLQEIITNSVGQKKRQLEMWQRMLQSLSPYKVLKRGYAIVANSHGVILRSAFDITQVQSVDIMLADGKLAATVYPAGEKDAANERTSQS